MAPPWMARVLPVIEEIVRRHPERTVFSRFITPDAASDMPGMRQRYYMRWRMATHGCIDPELLELMPELRRYSPPAMIIDARIGYPCDCPPHSRACV